MAQLLASLFILALGCLIVTNVLGELLLPSPPGSSHTNSISTIVYRLYPSHHHTNFSLLSRSGPLHPVIVFDLAIARLKAHDVKPKGKLRQFRS
jgi:hypothetical protein